jgi:tetratricopeptide (TPR) repeat protein
MYQDAKSLLENALDQQEKKYGLAHPNTIDCLNQLVDFYKSQNKFDDATQVLRDALAIRENHPNLGLAHSETARSLDQLVSHYRDQGKLKDATKILEEALARRMDKLGEEDPETIRCQSQLDNLSENLNKIKPKRTLGKQAAQSSQKEVSRPKSKSSIQRTTRRTVDDTALLKDLPKPFNSRLSWGNR